MRQRPWIVKLITVSLFLVPVVGFILIFWGTRLHHGTVNSVVITDLWLLTIGSVIVGFGVWKVRTWGFYLLLLFGALIIGADVQQIISNPKTLNIWDFGTLGGGKGVDLNFPV